MNNDLKITDSPARGASVNNFSDSVLDIKIPQINISSFGHSAPRRDIVTRESRSARVKDKKRFLVRKGQQARKLSRQLFEEQTSKWTIVKASVAGLMGQLPQTLIASFGEHGEFVLDLLESVTFLIYHLTVAENGVGYSMAIANFVKMQYKGSMLYSALENSGLVASRTSAAVEVLDDLFGPYEAQSDGNPFARARAFLDTYAEIKHSKIYLKLYKFSMYMLSMSMFDRFGVTFEKCRYSKVEAEAIKAKHHLGHDFVFTMLDTALFVCERGYQCMITGSMDPIYHSGSRYEKWFNDVTQTLLEAKFLNNPEPHGIDEFKTRQSLKDLLEQGECIYKHAVRLDSIEKSAVRKMLGDLRLADMTLTSAEYIQRDRKSPFAVLVHGGSSVMKTQFKNMLFYHYAALFNLQNGPQYKYTHNPVAKYWDGFRSHMWFLVMDDIAFLNPAKAPQGDPSLLEMLQVVNNQPYAPDQAALEDKGKVCCMPRFVVATTNTADLNVDAYFSCPLAVRRRLPFTITISPKKDMAKYNVMMDSSKVPETFDGTYPDVWEIEVYRIEPHTDVHKAGVPQRAKSVLIGKYTDVREFVKWFSKEAIIHEATQAKAANCDKAMSTVKLCQKCYVPKNMCDCDSLVAQGPPVRTMRCARCRKTLDQCICNSPLLPQGTSSAVRSASDMAEVMETIDEAIDDIEWIQRASQDFVPLGDTETQRPDDGWTIADRLAGRLYDTRHHNPFITSNPFDALGSSTTSETSSSRNSVFRSPTPSEAFREAVHPPSSYASSSGNGSSTEPLPAWYTEMVQPPSPIPFEVGPPAGPFLPGAVGSTPLTPDEDQTEYLRMLDVAMKEVDQTTFWSRCCDWVTSTSMNSVIYLYCHWSWFRWIFSAWWSWTWIRNWVMNRACMKVHNSRLMKAVVSKCGDRVQKRLLGANALLTLTVTLTTVLGSCAIIGLLIRKALSPKSEIQGNTSSKPVEAGKRPVPRDERVKNVWYNDSFVATPLDVTKQILSWKGLPRNEVFDIVARNCVVLTLEFKAPGDERVRAKKINSFCIGGNVYIFNRHNLPSAEFPGVRVFTACVGYEASGISLSARCEVKLDNAYEDPSRDIVAFQMMGLPPKRDLRSLFPPSSYRGRFDGTYVDYFADYATRRSVVALKREMTTSVLGEMDVWMGHSSVPTVKGDCGSVLLMFSEQGPILLGLHTLGEIQGSTVVVPFLSNEYVLKVSSHFSLPVVDISSPVLSSASVTKNLGDLHVKSPVRFVEQGCATVYGSLDGFRLSPNSDVEDTILKPSLQKRGLADIKHVAPIMKKGESWKPWYKSLNDMSKPLDLDSELVEACAKSFFNDIMKGLSKEDLDELGVVDLHTALNGAAGVGYVDKLNRNTSAGFPFKKCKRNFLIEDATSEMEHAMKLDDEMYARVVDCDAKYRSGHTYAPVFCANLKDEPRPREKVLDGNVRVFAGGPMDWCIVARKYFIMIQRLMKRNRFLFEQAPGIRAQSLDWQQLGEFLSKHGKHRVFAGDYAKFDKRMSALVILWAFWIMIEIAKVSGQYDDGDIQAMWCIAYDVAYPTMDYNGDLIQFHGSNPSGQILTVEINGFVNSIYMRYAYATGYREYHGYTVPWMTILATFTVFVVLMTYGDDNAVGVSELVDWFDHTAVSEWLGMVGIVYTMADKTAESTPFTPFEDINFLKRRWRYDEDLGAMAAPLELESITKMLSLGVRSKTISPQEQAVEVVSSAVREYFFHGRSVFEEKSEMLKEVLSECCLDPYVTTSTFPSWECLREGFWRNSEGLEIVGGKVVPC